MTSRSAGRRRGGRAALAAAHVATLAALALGACSRPAAEPPVSRAATLVLISIDTLRADRLAAYGRRGLATPAIDRLARDGVLFENAYSPYPLTLPAHVSLLSGLVPPRHGVRDNLGYPVRADRHAWLPSLARDAGYATAGFVSAYVLRGDSGFAAGFESYDAPAPGGDLLALDLVQRPGAATVAAAVRWLETAASRPRLLFVHLYEPHAPYTPPEPFRASGADAYDGEIAAADAAVGELLAALDRLGLYDGALVVLFGDHGEGLGDHGEQQHGVLLYRSTLQVPLIVKLPGAARGGERVARPVGLVDVAPTLLRHAGVTPPAGLDGSDLLRPGAPAGATDGYYAETYYPSLHFGWSPLRGWTEARWSLVEGPAPELFDLEHDPAQLASVLAANRRERARLLALVEAHSAPPPPPDAVDESTAQRLLALGYLAGGRAAPGSDAPDPRTKLAMLALYERAVERYWAGDDPGAEAALAELVAAEPDMADAWGFLARVRDRSGHSREALAAWRRLLELSGGRGATAATVAERLLALGELDEAARLAAALADALPVRSLELLVAIDLARGERGRAEERIRAAASRGVLSEPLHRQLALAALQGGRPTAALEWLAALGAGASEPARILESLALADAGRGREAEAALAAARDASPDPAQFFEALGVALLELGRFDRAAAALAEAVRLRPDLATAWNSLGVARLRVEGPAGAREAWRRALALDPALSDARRNLELLERAAEGRR